MGNIKVPAGNDRLFCIQGRKIIRIKLVPLLAVRKPLKTIARVWSVDICKVKIVEVKDKQAALIVHCVRRTQSYNFAAGSQPFLIENHRTRIAFFCRRYGRKPLNFVTGKVF